MALDTGWAFVSEASVVLWVPALAIASVVRASAMALAVPVSALASAPSALAKALEAQATTSAAMS